MKKKKPEEFYEGHSKEFTRRQFLFNAGATSVASYMALTNLPQLLTSKAYAQATNNENLAYVGLECAGGINMAGNVIVGRDNSGTQDEYSSMDSYLFMGFTPELHPSRTGMVDETFGLKFHATSGVLKGMKQVLDGKTVTINGSPVLISDMVDGIFMAYRSVDDSGGNPINPSIPVVKAGAHGKLVNLIGNIPSSNGGSSITDPAVYDPMLRPPVVNNAAGAKGLVSLGGFLQNTGNRSNFSDFMTRISNISKERLALIADSKLRAKAKENINASFNNSAAYFNKFSETSLTPLAVDSTDLYKVFPNSTPANLFQGNLAVDLDQIGTISYLLLHDNLVGSAMIAVGGGDYHDGSAASGTRKDLELGRYIGEMIYYAALKGRNLVIDLFTDGSAICDTGGVIDESVLGQGRVIHYTDSPVQSGSIMLVYRHGKTRETQPIVKYKQSGSTKSYLRQIGYFLPGKGGGIDLSANSLANSTAMAWKVKMLNYLALMDENNDPEGVVLKFEKIYGRGLLGTDAKDMIRFNYIG